MIIKKVVLTQKVKYPTKQDVLKDRSLLSVLPKRWQNNKIVLTAVSSLIAISVTSCNVEKGKDSNSVSHKVIVAPVFKHGIGKSSYGGVGGAYYAPISENEARNIIIQEAKSLGLKLNNKELKIDNVSTPETCIFYNGENNEKLKVRKPSSFSLDLKNDKGTIAIEYVSGDDYDSWKKETTLWSTVTINEPIVAASSLVEEGFKNAKSKTVEAVGVLYDPSEENAKELLKMQVKDFFNWLKGQGVV